jgi:hypothetical protein
MKYKKIKIPKLSDDILAALAKMGVTIININETGNIKKPLTDSQKQAIHILTLKEKSGNDN